MQRPIKPAIWVRRRDDIVQVSKSNEPPGEHRFSPRSSVYFLKRAAGQGSRSVFLNVPFWIALATGLIFLLFSESQLAASFENHFFDAFMRWSADPKKWPDDIALVMIDDQSLLKLNAKEAWRWEWPRKAYAALVASLHKNGAKAVIFDILFPGESENAVQDGLFAAYIQAAGNVWLAAAERADGPPIEPGAALKTAAGKHLGWVNFEKDPDGVARNYRLVHGSGKTSRKSISAALQGVVHYPPIQADQIFLRYQATYQQLSDRDHAFSAGPFVIQGLQILLKGSQTKGFDEFDPKQVADLIRKSPVDPNLQKLVQGKIIFIGCSGVGTFDPMPTPLDRHQSGVIVQATALANLVRGDYLRSVNPWARRSLMIFTLTSIILICVCLQKVRWQTALTFLVLVGVGGLSFLLFQKGLWLGFSICWPAGLFCFLGITIYNYVTEGRQRRWLKQLFSDFVSPDVLVELQQSPQGLNLKGERRSGTVLFCDLVGFTTLAATTTPEQFIDAINNYLSEASKVLLSHEAYIDKFIGDAVMAVFGVPKPQPDHALKACLSALDLQEMIIRLNDQLGTKYNLKLSLRVGVNTGEMTAGPMGYARKLNYTVVGDTVNLASRLEGANKLFHTRIMIGPQTYEQAKNGIEARFLDLLRVKGEVRAFPVYEVLGRKGCLSPEKVKWLALYSQGIWYYREKRWNEAVACFGRALDFCKEDGPSQTYRERCEGYRDHSPAPDWDGSFSLDSK